MKSFVFYVLILTFFTSSYAIASGKIFVPVGEASLIKEKVFFILNGLENIKLKAVKNKARELKEIIQDDIMMYRLNYEISEGIKPDYVVTIDALEKGTKLYAKVNLMNRSGAITSIVSTAFVNFRKEAHEISHIIYKTMSGKDSIFLTKIIFVSDIACKGGTHYYKELYMSDYDGKNIEKLTNHRGTVISPAISNDRKYIVYSLIKESPHKVSHYRNVDLYAMNLQTKKVKLLSSKKGINSGAVFLPDNKHIALSLSYGGNAEIYIMNIETKKLRKITRHSSIDVDPSINKNGTLMTFLSGRSGKPMVYTLDPRGVERNVKRISYVGRFNATPRFSPDGKLIVFSSWLDNRFDIFRINSDGTGLFRLSKNFGSNEDPSFSRDGEFIIFSSQRVLSRTKAVQNIYIMNKEGDIVKTVTSGFGSCITPRWSY